MLESFGLNLVPFMYERFMTLLRPAATLTSCTLFALPAIADSPKILLNDIGTLGGPVTVVNDINQHGDATGYSETSNGQIHAFVYTRGAIHDIGTLGGTGSLANAINDAGEITGFAVTAAGETHAFLYQNGTMSDLGTAGTASTGKAINQGGQVAGDATAPGAQSKAALFSGGNTNVFGTLGTSSTSESINNRGQISGTYTDTSGSHVFLYSSGSLVDLMPGISSFVTGTRTINSFGAVAGNFQPAGTQHGFLYVNGTATDIGSLGGGYTVTTAISNSGKVTGISGTASGERHAFIYSGNSGNSGSSGSGFKDLGTLGASPSVGYALNDSDQVTGESMTSDGTLHAFVTQNGTLVDLGPLVQALAPGSNVLESLGVGINQSGQLIGRYIISTPTDTQMPTKTRSFIASTGPSALSALGLFQTLLSTVAGIGPGNGLLGDIQQALVLFLISDTSGSCSNLNAFLNGVNAQAGQKIDPQTAQQLLQEAGALEGVIGCSS
jgi:probable HAF family extracellular repeat protein